MRKLFAFSAASSVCLSLVFSSAQILRAEIRQDAARNLFILRSGSVEYCLAQRNGTVYLEYFGPANAKPWDLSPAQQRPIPYNEPRVPISMSPAQSVSASVDPGTLNMTACAATPIATRKNHAMGLNAKRPVHPAEQASSPQKVSPLRPLRGCRWTTPAGH